jgi:hypothetical protein
MLDRLIGNLRFALGVAGYLRHPVTVEAGRAHVRDQVPRREASFLDLAERGIYQNRRSPYRRLLEHAGIDHAALTRLVGEHGLEGALERLYQAGVYVSYEELRGRKPVRRGNLEFTVKVSDFDNPLLTAFSESRTSGSRSSGTRVFLDLTMLEIEAYQLAAACDAHGAIGRPLAVWRPQPPSSVGVNAMLRYTKFGMRPSAWFSQGGFRFDAGGWRGAIYLGYVSIMSRVVRQPFPWPRFVPQDRADIVADWLAGQKRRDGTAAVLDTSVSGATRVCQNALDRGLDISGSIVIVGGEPLTEARGRIIHAAGATAIDRYAMLEAGTVALGCARPTEVDDMRLVREKLAVFNKDKTVGAQGETVPALVYTTLLPNCQMIMLNAESGDYGIVEERDCGCGLGAAGYATHIAGVRGYDKLTSEGITFMGSELYRLVEETLPARFGGHATDYQLVEEDDNGIPKVSIVASPRLGEIDDAAVIEVVLGELKNYYAVGRLATTQWRQGQTLRVIRREPYASGGRKILPLHILRSANKAGRG